MCVTHAGGNPRRRTAWYRLRLAACLGPRRLSAFRRLGSFTGIGGACARCFGSSATARSVRFPMTAPSSRPRRLMCVAHVGRATGSVAMASAALAHLAARRPACKAPLQSQPAIFALKRRRRRRGRARPDRRAAAASDIGRAGFSYAADLAPCVRTGVAAASESGLHKVGEACAGLLQQAQRSSA